MFGKILSANGNASSINGTSTKIDIGTKRKTSVTVRSSCFLSRRDSVLPRSVRPRI